MSLLEYSAVGIEGEVEADIVEIDIVEVDIVEGTTGSRRRGEE